MNKQHTLSALKRIGKATEVAAKYGVSRQTVYDWMNLGLTETRCYQIAHDTGYKLDLLLNESRETSAA